MKTFLIDIARCNGCRNCQISCKDEHCGNDWTPYAKPQPESGQFWCHVEERTRGTVPLTRITYIPHIGAQTEAIRQYAPELVQDREDGIIVIDPEKAAGREDLADSFDGVYWNETLDIPQGCTGCAHLLDNGWTVPRCVDACPTGALRFGDEADFAAELRKAKQLEPGSHVYYLNMPKRFVGATVIDPSIDEVVIGALVLLKDETGSVKGTARTDEFGDFLFNQIEPAAYEIEIKAHGYEKQSISVSVVDGDANAGVIELSPTR